MSIRSFAVPLAVLFASFAGCSSDNPPADVRDGALACPAGSVVAYIQAGCGANAPPPYCQGPTDACVLSYCDCDGTTRAGGCGFALRPFQHAGPCETPDAPSEAGNEGGVEGGTEGGHEGGSPEAGPDAPVVDAPIDSPVDSLDGPLVCGQGFQVAYIAAGCGASAPAPYCQGPTDACALPFCDCDGTTHIGGCGYALRPFRYAGACVDGGDGGSDGGVGAGDSGGD